MSASALEAHLLELLVDGRSSFSTLYRAVSARPAGATSTPHPVERVWDALGALVSSRWARTRVPSRHGAWEDATPARLEEARRGHLEAPPRGRREEAPAEEAGVWFEIEPLGWARWARQAAAASASQRVVRELDPATSTITVRAADGARAEAALAEWLRLRPGLEVVPSTRTVQPSGFHLGDGTRVEGVTLRAAYRAAALERA